MSPKPITISTRDQGQILLRADLADAKTIAALKAAGLPTLDTRTRSGGDNVSAMWLSPDECLIFADDSAAMITKIKPVLPEKHLIHDVTGARVAITMTGDYLRDALAKNAPRDLPNVKIGEVVRTRMGQVAVAFWFLDKQTVELVCFRSVAEHVVALLEMAAKPDGLPVMQ